MLRLFSRERMWRRRDLQRQYDVVIIGAGIHGLAIAYYLCKRGIRNVAVLDRSYLGGGNSGRNTAILRSNYRTMEGIPFYDESLKMWENLSGELDYNLMFSQQGHITVAHTDASLAGLRVRASANQVLGVDSRLVDPGEIKKMVPAINVGKDLDIPLLAGYIIRPVATFGMMRWFGATPAQPTGWARQFTLALRSSGSIGKTVRSRVSAQPPGTSTLNTVVNATSGWCTTIARMAGVSLPVTSFPLQACVTEPLKPFWTK